MKKKQLKPALEALKTFHMTKITDKSVRNKLIALHFALLDEDEKYRKDIDKLDTVYFGPFEKERKEFLSLQASLNKEKDEAKRQEIIDKMNSFTELNKAAEEFTKAFEDLSNEEVKGFEPIDKSVLIEALSDQENAMIIAEALFPLCPAEEKPTE